MEHRISDYVELPGVIFRSHLKDAAGNPLSDIRVTFMIDIDSIKVVRQEPDEYDQMVRSAIADSDGNFYTVLMNYEKLKHYIEKVKQNYRKQQLLTLRQ